MPIYVDESGGISAGAMTMAGVEISEENAAGLLHRFKAVTGLRGEMKGSRIDFTQRGLFFELLERFHGRARVCIVRRETLRDGRSLSDFDVYVGLLKQLVDDWLPETGGCANFVVDEGRYNDLMLEKVRRDITDMLANFGSASLMDSARSPGVQIADVVANSFYNLAYRSRRSQRIAVIVQPFIEARVLRSHALTQLDHVTPSKSPAMLGTAGL